MSKFKGLLGKGKNIGAAVMVNGKSVLLTTGGVIVAQKFLDFKTLFPNVDPNKFFIKHEGAIKVAGVVLTLSMWKNCPEWLKWVLIGVAVQGGIKAARQYTMNKEGKAFFEAIQGGAYDEEIARAAAQITNAATEFPTQVAGSNTLLEDMPAVQLSQDSGTTIAGDDDEINGNDFFSEVLNM